MSDTTPALPTAEALAALTLATQHPLTRGWDSDEARLPRLTEDHRFDLRLATDPQLNAERAAFVNLPRRAEAEYLNRWVPVGGDLWAMLSVRFEGPDVTRPFVDLSGASRPWTRADLPALGDAARAACGALRPAYLRLWHPADLERLAALGLDRLGPDRRTLAAPLGELAAANLPIPPGLRLAPATDLSHYEEARAAYRAVDAEHPAHPDQAKVQPREDLEALIGDGELLDIRDGDSWVGYTGAARRGHLGLDSFSVQELILTPQARGRGLGAALSVLLARAVLERGADPAQVLTGSVHAGNRGARAAALRAGRRDVGGQLQLPL